MFDADLEAYLAMLVRALRDVLQHGLVGLYLVGSTAQDDRVLNSDIDILGVVSSPLSKAQKSRLARRLDHARMPVPASGLDLLLVQLESTTTPAARPAHEFWFFTGAGRPTEIEMEGSTSEHLIVFEACRAYGRSLIGPSASEVFAPLETSNVVRALRDLLAWHKLHLLDRFHDPHGDNSVLNACRVWHYIEEGALCSKSAGGQWALAREPSNAVVRTSLRNRQGFEPTDSSLKAIGDHMNRVIDLCDSIVR